MNEFVKDPTLIKVSIGDETQLTISPTTDVIHHWKHNNARMLKYWDEEDGVMKNVCLNDVGFETLIKHGIPVAERDHMSVSEFDHWVGVVAMTGLNELDFEPEQSRFGWTSEGEYIKDWIKE